MHTIDPTNPISPYCQHIVDEIFNHEINVSPQNYLGPIYGNYPKWVDDERGVVLRVMFIIK